MTKNTKTVGTLQEIGAKVGDVVQFGEEDRPIKVVAWHLCPTAGLQSDGYRIVYRVNPNYLDGSWHDWHGGECPVPVNVVVETEGGGNIRGKAWDVLWRSVRRFRVVQPNAEAPNSPVGGEVGVAAPDGIQKEECRQNGDFEHDMINAPPHYTSHPSGIEPIQITQHMPFCEGNVIKYVMRAPYKGDTLKDLRKAAYYIQRAIEIEEGKA